MSIQAPKGQEAKLIEAAAEAKVPWILPNEYGSDPDVEQLGKDIFVGPGKVTTRSLIQSLGVSSWIALVCNLWYEFSLAGSAARYGFDFPRKIVTFFDDGNVKINTSTWDQCARAVASLLSLKVLPEDANDTSLTLFHFQNKPVYISSFLLSQRDMLDSILRVTGESEKHWTIKQEDTRDRYQHGVEKMHKGDPVGLAEAMYSRVFFPNGGGDYESKGKLHNVELGLQGGSRQVH